MGEGRGQPLIWRVGSSDAPTRKSNRAVSAIALAARFCAFAAESTDQQAVYDEACRVAVKGLDADYAGLLAYDPCRKDFLIVAGVGWKPGVVGHSRLKACDRTALGLGWVTRECVLSNDVDDDDYSFVQDLLAEQCLATRIDVLLPGDGSAGFGVLRVGSSRHGLFTSDDADFINMLAHGVISARQRLAREALEREREDRHLSERHAVERELHHRIRNDLQCIYSRIDHERRQRDDCDREATFGRIGNQVMAIAVLYDHLVIRETSGQVDLGSYLRALCLNIVAAAGLASRGIEMCVDVRSIVIPVDRAQALAIAVNELIANAGKHAFSDERTGRITVCLRPLEADGPRGSILTVSDDGCGYKGQRAGGAGLGFVNRLVGRAGGVLTRVDGRGTAWQIVVAA